ncbi:Seven_transmembrane protein 1 [Hexamita inflata]|uniref:Seven_transmembrane protein 1 n=1 Tax=Hexamita inflata TaxID=28002 RepID=A0ABP1HP20_9EUKA
MLLMIFVFIKYYNQYKIDNTVVIPILQIQLIQLQQSILQYYQINHIYIIMVCRCDGEYNKFISGIFGECVSGTQGVVSFIFGWISICCWIIAYVPQIRINFLLKRSDALSTVFLLCWIFGDISNLISCFMLNQLFTQQILSVLFIGFDVVLVGQQFYYQRPKNQAISLSIKLRISEALVYTFVIQQSLLIIFCGVVFITSLVFNYKKWHMICAVHLNSQNILQRNIQLEMLLHIFHFLFILLQDLDKLSKITEGSQQQDLVLVCSLSLHQQIILNQFRFLL